MASTKTTPFPQKPVLDPASTLILVTGASGYIASNIVKEALLLGYKVRGTARSEKKAAATRNVQGDHPNYTTVIVSGFESPSTELDAALKDVDSVIHVASDTSFSEDADAVIKTALAGTENVLRAAAKTPSVKRFTLTSSSAAAIMPIPDKEVTVTDKSWDDVAVDGVENHPGQAVGPNPYGFVVYAASKTKAEQAFWKYIKSEKPKFVANAILPNYNCGRILDPSGGASGTAALAVTLFKEGKRPDGVPPQYYINVIDNARLHLCAAVLDESLADERIYAFASPFNWNDAVDAIKRVRPDVKAKLEKDPDEPRDLSTVPNELGAKLLKRWFGQDGYTSFDQTMKENLERV